VQGIKKKRNLIAWEKRGRLWCGREGGGKESTKKRKKRKKERGEGFQSLPGSEKRRGRAVSLLGRQKEKKRGSANPLLI